MRTLGLSGSAEPSGCPGLSPAARCPSPRELRLGTRVLGVPVRAGYCCGGEGVEGLSLRHAAQRLRLQSDETDARLGLQTPR